MTTRKVKTEDGTEVVAQDGTVTAYHPDGSSEQVSFGIVIRIANPGCVDAAVDRYVQKTRSSIVSDRRV